MSDLERLANEYKKVRDEHEEIGIRREKVGDAVKWISWAETMYGMYDGRTAKVRRYFFGIVEPDRFPSVEIPEELKALGYK